MISMQYSFTLPADYDMGIIDRRIAEKGAMLDGFPGLGFKAYLTARKGELGSGENLYAPFYLWEDPDGLSNFVCGPGFAGVSDSFGRPSIKTWVVWQAAATDALGDAKFAARETLPIGPSADLAGLRKAESAAVAAGDGRALARVAGFDPTNWTIVRFSLWREAQEVEPGGQVYRVGHMSLSGRYAG